MQRLTLRLELAAFQSCKKGGVGGETLSVIERSSDLLKHAKSTDRKVIWEDKLQREKGVNVVIPLPQLTRSKGMITSLSNSIPIPHHATNILA